MTDQNRLSRQQTRSQNELLDLERMLLDPEVRHSRVAVELLLHSQFKEFGSSGRVYDRDTMIKMMNRETSGQITIRDFDARMLSTDVCLVTYRSVGESQEARRSSVWVRDEGRWQVIFHQGTKIPGRLSQG